MSLVPDTRLGPYEIIAAIGAGGMGEVYRARDTRLNRDVAIKVLLPAVAADPDRLARFQREAFILASLNHPNIAQIHGLEDSAGVPALVMEFVEGPTLADTIVQRAMPLTEALPIAKQIAEALEAAHEKGIIHRDLKPANIKIASDGRVKVLDFGLAKAIESERPAVDVSHSPTMMRDTSMPGMLLGTAAYMSPEQAKGRVVDKRTDIFAFGCVLYEMLTGTRVFDGDDVADIVSAVLRTEPDWTRLPTSVPASVRTLLRLCLEKNAKNRRSDATDVRLDIEQAMNAPPDTDTATRVQSRAREWTAWIIATASLVAAVVLAVLYVRPAAPPVSDATRLYIEPPADSHREGSATAANGEFRTTFGSPAMSADGRKVAFVVADAAGKPVLSVRDLSSPDAYTMPNTDGAGRPFWSPDGRYLGFAVDGQLKKMALSTVGIAETLCPAPGALGATWNAADVVVFSSRGSLYRIDARGGRPAVVKQATGTDRYVFPQFLPDGDHVLYTAVTNRNPDRGAFVISLQTGTTTRLTDADHKVVYSSGHLLSVQNGDLLAQAFDVKRLQVSGDLRRLGGFVNYIYNASREAAFDASANGQLVYLAPPSTNDQLTWFDRSGHVVQKVGPAGEYRTLTLAPDGTRVAFDRMSTDGTGVKVWVLDLATETLTRITSDRANDWAPLWSPDSRTLVFSSDRDGPLPSLYLRAADGQGSDHLLLHADFDARSQAWGPPGLVVSGGSLVTPEGGGLRLVHPEDRAVTPLQTIGQFHAQFSPDGQFVAYDSAESGTQEVYLRRFPISSERWRVSSKGGSQPHWKGDGRELYYGNSVGQIVATRIDREPQVTIGREEILFQTPQTAGEFSGFRSSFAVAPDGSRFLFANNGGRRAAQSLIAVLHWPAILQR